MIRYGLILLWFIPVISFSQIRTFALQNVVSSRIAIDTTIHSSTQLFPFYTKSPISGLVFSGEISLNSDSSLIRIVLMDIDYNEYLIYETFPILSGLRQFSVDSFGEETSLLNNITPAGVRLEIIDASIHLKEFITSEGGGLKATEKSDMAHEQSQYKIDRINRNIDSLGLKWVAGETSISRLTYQEKLTMFGERIPNFQGFEYYKGGFFSLPGSIDADQPVADSDYVSEFSWRNRHGKDWVTPVKSQGNCGSCWAYGPTAALELLINLFYNRQLNYDLSEQNIVSCTSGTCIGGFAHEAADFIMNSGLVPEECFPYAGSNQPCDDICSNPSDKLGFTSWTSFQSTEDIKKEIIKGAAVARVIPMSHVFGLVGYRVIDEGDSLFIKDNETEAWVSIERGDPLIGRTVWLLKNSWGADWGDHGFVYIYAKSIDIQVLSFSGPVISEVLTSKDIRCADDDGDGYYTWGNGVKPAHCPDCPPEADGDDSNPCIGPMDTNGNLSYVTSAPEADDLYQLSGHEIPDLQAEGFQIRWYNDKQLKNLVYSGNEFNTGQVDLGKHTFYITQTDSGCESAAREVSLSILNEIPRPNGNNLTVYEGKSAVLKVQGVPGGEFSWYADSLLIAPFNTGDTLKIEEAELGVDTFYVTQTLSDLESAPEVVLLSVINNDFVCGDSILHEGKFYGTTYIGRQCWFSENLNIGNMIDFTQNQINNGVLEKYCYEDDERNCDRYGGLYTWDEYTGYIEDTSAIQGICPSGWHAHTDRDWQELELFLGLPGSELEKTSYRGTDEGGKLKEGGEFEFNALYGGYGKPYDLIESPSYKNENFKAQFWASKFSDSTFGYLSRGIYWNSQCIWRNIQNKHMKLSARCVKNMPIKELFLNYYKTDVSCFGEADGSIDLRVTGGLGPYSYTWSNGETSGDLSSLSPGQYSIQVSDAGKNSVSDLIEITQADPVPKPKVSDVEQCEHDPIPYLNAIGENIQWYYDPEHILLFHSGPAYQPGKLYPGTYTYYVTQTILGCEGLEKAVQYTINELPEIDLGQDTTLLQDQTMFLGLYPGEFTYYWNDGTEYPYFKFDRNEYEPGEYLISVFVTKKGCSYRDSILVSIKNSNGVNEEKSEAISIYPNPGYDFITVRFKEPGKRSMVITSINGQIIHDCAFKEASHQIDLTSFQKGVYFITVRSGSLVKTAKIVKL